MLSNIYFMLFFILQPKETENQHEEFAVNYLNLNKDKPFKPYCKKLVLEGFLKEILKFKFSEIL